METTTDRFFRQLCDGLGFVCIAVDRDLRIQFWNREAAEQFHHSSDEMSGRPFLEILSDADRQEAQRCLEQTISTGRPHETEVKYSGNRGARRTLVLIISPIFDEDGQCIGASAGMRDISKRKRMSRELADSRRMSALGRMAGGVAHHFNNILGGMLTSIDYVLSSDSPRELRRTLRLLSQAIGRATRITHQLAAFAESENQLIEWKELNPILDVFLDRLRPQARKARITLETDIEQVPSATFEADRLLPVLESLAQNAFDAMSEGGTLSIKMARRKTWAVITIADTGCGIPEDIKDRLFEPFFTTKGELAGGGGSNIGLGLAAVHGLVSEMEGTIRLNSQVGEGTQVEVRLPLNRKPLNNSDQTKD